MSSGLLKLKINCLAIMTIVMFGRKRVRLAGERHHVVRVLCCRRDRRTSFNRWLHEEKKIYWSNISRHLKAKWLKDNKVKVLEWPSQSPGLKPIGNVWTETEKACESKEAYKPDSVTLIRRNGPKGQSLLVRRLWKLPIMWERDKRNADINHSLYYYHTFHIL